MDGRDITGNTVFRMNERMDAGDILIKESVPVSPYENSSELEAKLSEKGALLLLKALDLVEEEEAYFEPQNEEEATYTGKIQRREGLVDWSMSASDIANRVRGLQPWPGAYTFVAERRLKLLSVKKVRKDIRDRMPGEVLSEEPLEVACGRDAVVLEKVQLEGKKALAGPDFARGSSVAEGTVLGKEEDGTK
jgi:methionyl-tRNA formyltransferase